MKRILPPIFYNPISLVGAVIATTNIGFILFLTIWMVVTDHAGPYADIIVYFLMPMLVFGGMILMVAGVLWERRRQQKGLPLRQLPVVDLNDPKHRRTAVIVGTTLGLMTLVYAFAGYKTYEFSESTQFCGQTCHGVMRPQYTAHQFSYHAEVGCADCHVGSGAKYFIETKLNGTRQLLGVMTGNYARPIPVPVRHLRPAQDTCETCHGPQYQFSERLESRTYFLPDETNTAWTVGMILKMGEAKITTDRPPRIHWHSSTTKEILYATADPKRVEIPWLQATRRDGTVRTYHSKESKLSVAEMAALPKRTMDCVDCHNRSGHYYRPAAQSVNTLMNMRVIDPTLPGIKSAAVEALDADYTTAEEARADIRNRIETFYREKHPTDAAARKPQIERAIVALQNVYDRNYDPHMKVTWKNYPDNSSHLYSPGCFRCHDGKHVTDDGHVLSNDCTLCHTLVSHDIAADLKTASVKLMEYPHPEDIGDAYKESLCSDCHGAQK